MKAADILVRDEGTVVLLTPISDAAEAWVEEHVGYEMTWAGAIVCEPRYVAAILEGAVAEGFTVHLKEV